MAKSKKTAKRAPAKRRTVQKVEAQPEAITQRQFMSLPDSKDVR